ncbi:M48 family metallopeptidase [Thermosulfuriphilus sp.]
MSRHLASLLVVAFFLVGCATITGPQVTERERREAQIAILTYKWKDYLHCQQRVGKVLYRLLLAIDDGDGRRYPYVGIKVINLADLGPEEKEALGRAEGLRLPNKGYVITYLTPYYEKAGLGRFEILAPESRGFRFSKGEPLRLEFLGGQRLEIPIQMIQTRPADFKIVDSEQINAWVTPDYVVHVTTALCRILPVEDQLAAVLGHELAHLKRGHIGKRQGLVGLRDIFGLVIGSLGGQTAHDIYQVGTNFVLLKFSRDQEREADFFGLYYAYRAGFNLEKAADTWLYLGAVLPRTNQPSLLLTHPVTEERLARIRKIVALIKQGKTFEDLIKTER